MKLFNNNIVPYISTEGDKIYPIVVDIKKGLKSGEAISFVTADNQVGVITVEFMDGNSSYSIEGCIVTSTIHRPDGTVLEIPCDIISQSTIEIPLGVNGTSQEGLHTFDLKIFRGNEKIIGVPTMSYSVSESLSSDDYLEEEDKLPIIAQLTNQVIHLSNEWDIFTDRFGDMDGDSIQGVGIAPNILVGNVETLPEGSTAYITRRGTNEEPIFDFGIPRGENGENGDTSNLVTLTQLSEQLSNHYTKSETDNKVSEEIAKLQLNGGFINVAKTFELSDFKVSNGDVVRQSGTTYYVDVLATQGHLVRCNLDPLHKLFSFRAERGMYWITLGSDTSNTYSTIVSIGNAQPGKIVVMNNSNGSIQKVIRNQSNSHVNTGASYSVGSIVNLRLTDSALIITINGTIYMEVPFSLMSGDNAQYITNKYLGFYLNISGAEVYNNNPTIFLSNPNYYETVNIDLSDYVKKSELNDIVSQIKALRSDVDKLLQNNGGEGEVEKLYYNPTITIENNRAVFREDGYEERFLITHVENKNDPNYRGSVQVRGSDGYDYYVLLTDNAESTNSKFRYNNLIPSHGGWMSLENKANQPYQFAPDRTYPYRNGFNFTDTVENVGGSVNSELLNSALEHLNTSFPAVNMQVATSSKNKIRQQSVQDPWWGAHYPYPGYFDIIINERVIENWAGPYGAGYFDYSDRGCWEHTVLHELGHTFGLKDQPKHDPSLFNYDASYEQLAGELFLQPNDMCALSYFYKKHYNLDITPETTQEDINKQLAQNAQVLTLANELDTCEVEDADTIIDFMYPTFNTTDIKVKVSDVVVRCKLKFDKEEKIQITKDESNNISLRYNVFTIEPLEVFKGELVNNKLKIHISENMNIDENAEYFAYLVNYEDVPCSLINPKQGLEKLS